MPSPSSITPKSTHNEVWLRETRTSPPVALNLIALESRLHTPCRSRSGSPSISKSPLLTSTNNLICFSCAKGGHHFDSRADHKRQIHRFKVQSELTGDDSGRVDQVVNHVGKGLDCHLDAAKTKPPDSRSFRRISRKTRGSPRDPHDTRVVPAPRSVINRTQNPDTIEPQPKPWFQL
jgi:hypothetical protein